MKIIQKSKGVRFLDMLLGILGASVLGNMLACKSVIRPSDEVRSTEKDF